LLVSKRREKTWLLGTLAAVLSVITIIVIWQRHHLIVPWWGIAVVAAPWVGAGMVLRAKQDSLGAEGKYVDWWSLPHYFAGVLFALLGIGLVYVVAIASVWEVIEIYANTKEYPTNRVTDIVLAALGWASAMLVCGGSFPLV
jgi:hypothetical protein